MARQEDTQIVIWGGCWSCLKKRASWEVGRPRICVIYGPTRGVWNALHLYIMKDPDHTVYCSWRVSIQDGHVLEQSLGNMRKTMYTKVSSKIDGYPSPQAPPLLVVMLSPVLVSLFRLLPLFFPFSSRPFALIFYLGDAEEKENAVPHSDGRTPHDFAGGCRVGIGNRPCKRAEKTSRCCDPFRSHATG